MDDPNVDGLNILKMALKKSVVDWIHVVLERVAVNTMWSGFTWFWSA